MQTEVNKRLGRPTPTFTYLDYFTLNVRPIEPSSATAPFDVHRTAAKTYATLRADVRVFGDRSEDTFILLNHDMEFQSKGWSGSAAMRTTQSSPTIPLGWPGS